MKGLNLNITSKGKRDGIQEVQGVIVQKMGKEFVFNYNTALDPSSDDLDYLKDFRNRFVNELEQLNAVLSIKCE